MNNPIKNILRFLVIISGGYFLWKVIKLIFKRTFLIGMISLVVIIKMIIPPTIHITDTPYQFNSKKIDSEISEKIFLKEKEIETLKIQQTNEIEILKIQLTNEIENKRIDEEIRLKELEFEIKKHQDELKAKEIENKRIADEKAESDRLAAIEDERKREEEKKADYLRSIRENFFNQKSLEAVCESKTSAIIVGYSQPIPQYLIPIPPPSHVTGFAVVRR